MKFKVGDRVQINTNIKDYISGNYNGLIGEFGTIATIQDNEMSIGVRFDNYISILHDLNGLTKNGYGFWCNEDWLDLIGEPKITGYASKYGVCDMKINENIKENNMELLDIYADRKFNKIEQKRVNDIEKIMAEDEGVIVRNKCIEMLKPFFKKCDEGYYDFEVSMPEYSKDTLSKTGEINKKAHKEENEVKNLCIEINAQLEICENYEQKINVLKTYKVINENGKINA